MQSDSDVITLTCPKCLQKIEERLGVLKADPVFLHAPCKAVLQFNEDEFARIGGRDCVEGEADLTLTLV